MGIIKKIIAEIFVIIFSLIVSMFGVSFLNVTFQSNVSVVQSTLIAFSIWFIILFAAQPAIWQKGYLTKLDRLFSFALASIMGISIYLSLEVLAANIFPSKQIILGLQIGYISNFISPIAGLFFCYFSLKRTSRQNESHKKEADEISKNRVSSNCPNCGLEYANLDYREDAEEWFCSQCRAKLPKI